MLSYANSVRSAVNNRRWLIAAGGFVLLLTWCRGSRPTAQQHEVESRSLEAEIQRQRSIAASAARTERRVIAACCHPERSEGPTICHPERSEGPAVGRAVQQQVLRFAQDDSVAQDDTVNAILVAEDSALTLAHVQITALDTALDLSELRAAHAELLVHQLSNAKECRIARLIPCPSRAVAALLGAAALAVVLRRSG
jgi:hypothetical protein